MSPTSSAVSGRAAAAPSSLAGVPEIEYPSPLSTLPDEPLPFVVKNTFIDTAKPSSLLGSSTFAPRAIHSWGPGNKRGSASCFGSSCHDEEELTNCRSRSTSAGASTHASGSDEGRPAATHEQHCTHCSTPRECPMTSVKALPEMNYPTHQFSVRNTFIDAKSGGQLPSMVDDAFEDRKVRSCPTSLLGGGIAEADLEGILLTSMPEQQTGDDEDDFTPSPVLSQSHEEVEEENACDLVPTPMPAFSPVDMMEAIAPQHFLSEGWTPPSLVPPTLPPCLPTPAPATPSEEEAESASSVADVSANISLPVLAMVRVISAQPLLGSSECPTVGSQLHYLGTCRPCAHAFTKGCNNGAGCQFCHLCGPGELKRRQKERRSQLARQQAQERRAQGSSGSAKGRRAAGYRA